MSSGVWNAVVAVPITVYTDPDQNFEIEVQEAAENALAAGWWEVDWVNRDEDATALVDEERAIEARLDEMREVV